MVENDSVRKVVWPTTNEPPIGAIKPARQNAIKASVSLRSGGAMLEVKVENCAGIDVGKKFLAVCVLSGPADRKSAEEVRRFGTSVKELERLRAWLMEKKCTRIAGGWRACCGMDWYKEVSYHRE